jgi:hypothetical protein
MRILRGLGSRTLNCGCLVGLYETYSARTVAIIDARGSECRDPGHKVDADVDLQRAQPPDPAYPPSTIPTSNR